MFFLTNIFVFLAGASFGSFLNVLIDRLPRNESVFNSRSRCESCNKKLMPQDLIPVVSYLTLLGKCRYCHAKIPSRIFLVEFLSGLTALFLYYYVVTLGLSYVAGFFLFAIILCFLGIFFADFASGIIPDELTATIVFSSVVLIFLLKSNIIDHILAAISAFVLFFALYSLTRGRGMGFGDVKLAGAIGFFLGAPNVIVGIYVAFLTAMFISIILILMGKKKFRGSTIAFGPFLSIGALVGYFLGARIVSIFI